MSLKYRLDVIDTCVQEGYGLPGQRTEKGSALKEAAFRLDMPYSTLKDWYRKNQNDFSYESSNEKSFEYSDLPPEDLDIEEILDFIAKRNTQKLENAQAKQWREIRINSNEPCVIAFVGDPHLDDAGCDITLLRNHLELLSQKNVYAFSCGDLHNNWMGSLQRLYSEQDTSRKTAIRLMNWFMNESNINWLGFILGNHDLWNNGSELMNLMNNKNVMMENWEIKSTLKFPSGVEIPIWLSHDFKGRSTFNRVHGLVKAVREHPKAKILAAGHQHTWGYYTEEMPDSDHVYHAIRARGYKFMDEHALVNGFSESKYGQTMCAVINPLANNVSEEITVFSDIERAILFKNALASSLKG